MNLLLIEDELLTREGIRQSVPWKALGIHEVREAVDGLDALEVAADFKPDIILTDVRMPRMDGVEAASQLRRMYPSAKIIFLSGYADKSYLKAAISLQAVSYVEKPVDLDEVEDALRKAVQMCLEERRLSELDAAAADTSPYIRQEVALELLRKGQDEESIRSRLGLTGMQVAPATSAVSLVIRLAEVANAGILQQNAGRLQNDYGIQGLFAQKEDHLYVLHLVAGVNQQVDEGLTRSFSRELSSSLRLSNVEHVLAAGQALSGLDRVYESYFHAVMNLQESFFLGPYSVVLYTGESKPAYEGEPVSVKQLLKEGDWNGARKMIQDFAHSLKRYPGTPVATVKDWFYRLLIEIEQFAEPHHVNVFPAGSADRLLWNCSYLEEARDLTLQALSRVENELQDRTGSTTASRIMRYIHQHYPDDTLSVTGISQEMQISPSHLIALFRETTGTTVKQYLMEYRVEKAKELLLSGQKLKVFDVASQVGFKDGEHFAKMFRKFTGMTPSEYRERFAP